VNVTGVYIMSIWAMHLPLDAKDADFSNSHSNIDAPCRVNPIIDLMLCDTPNIISPVQTETPSPVPRMLDAPGPSTWQNLSPLSNVPDRLNTIQTSEQMATLKRRRQASKGKGTLKAKRKIA
jgi:hypothetical protein